MHHACSVRRGSRGGRCVALHDVRIVPKKQGCRLPPPQASSSNKYSKTSKTTTATSCSASTSSNPLMPRPLPPPRIFLARDLPMFWTPRLRLLGGPDPGASRTCARAWRPSANGCARSSTRRARKSSSAFSKGRIPDSDPWIRSTCNKRIALKKGHARGSKIRLCIKVAVCQTLSRKHSRVFIELLLLYK